MRASSRPLVLVLLLMMMLLAVRVESTRVREIGEPVNGAAVTADSVWDAEAESPPAQRQRDRSLWGMSKRLVPTGPNPLHN